MTDNESTHTRLNTPGEKESSATEPSTAPEIVETIPNADHRHGDGRAEVIGIAVLDEQGGPLGRLEPSSRIVVRISARAKDFVARPIVGFMLRNQLGMDFFGTNTAREGFDMAPMEAGDVITVDFYITLPELYPAAFWFSPAIANGTLTEYVICDWIDNAYGLQMRQSENPIYGFFHLPCRVQVNSRIRAERSGATSMGQQRTRLSDFGREVPEASESIQREAVLKRAIEVIGDREQALRWLDTPLRALDYDTPTSRLNRPGGQADVLRVLTQLEHGVL
jgi:hypothetical protein